MPKRAGFGLALAGTILLFASCLANGRGLIVLCAGDSLTEQGYPPYLRRLLVREGIPARVVNYGKSGHTSGEYLEYLEKSWERMSEERPDVILIQLGTNDLRTDHDFTSAELFRGNLKKIIEKFRAFRTRAGKIPEILLATIPAIPPGSLVNFDDESRRRVEAEINPAIRALAAVERLPLAENHGVFVRRPDLLPGVHPSPEGYRLMAESFRNAFRSRF